MGTTIVAIATRFAGLVNDGSVSSLDDPIYKYLPWWTKDPKDEPAPFRVCRFRI